MVWKKIKVKGVHGNVVESPLARVWLHTSDYSIPLVVVAIENAQDKVLIGRDIGPVFNELMLQEICEYSTGGNIQNSKEFVDNEDKDKVEEDESVLVTRNQSMREEAEQRKSDEVVNEEGAMPKCQENFVDSLEKSAEKALCEVSEEMVLDFPLPNLIEGE